MWTPAIGECDFQIVATPGVEILSVTVKGQLPTSSNKAATLWDLASAGTACVIDNTPYSTTQSQGTLAPSGQVSMH